MICKKRYKKSLSNTIYGYSLQKFDLNCSVFSIDTPYKRIWTYTHLSANIITDITTTF